MAASMTIAKTSNTAGSPVTKCFVSNSASTDDVGLKEQVGATNVKGSDNLQELLDMKRKLEEYNYGGIPAKSDEAINEESQVDIISSWNIAESLPKKIQDHFVFIVSQFMYIPWNYAQRQAAIPVSSQDGDSCTPSITIGAAEKFESHVTEYIKRADELLFHRQTCGNCWRYYASYEGDKTRKRPSGNPQVAADFHKGDAALEFIKHVMRKNLLRFVRVREFAPEAEFRDQCHSFILPNVICRLQPPSNGELSRQYLRLHLKNHLPEVEPLVGSSFFLTSMPFFKDSNLLLHEIRK
ncbi:hypothetical protein K1719_046191 [Acacia pycnantha]|nr:hypothetical protein K1719_046191 [Acacia pycnantha]